MGAEELGITVTQAGQPRPYADSVYAGEVEAESKQQAREKLQEWHHGREILDQRDNDRWHMPYFSKLTEVGDGVWGFRFIEAYTG